jgi:hypothetical protein
MNRGSKSNFSSTLLVISAQCTVTDRVRAKRFRVFTGSHSRGCSRESIIVLFPIINCQRNVSNWIPDRDTWG